MNALRSGIRGVVLVIMAITMSVAVAQGAIPPWEIESLPGAVAPSFTLPDLSGKAIASSAFAGKVRLINFWATWCGPCREEMPDLAALQRRFTDQGLIVIGISIDSDRAAVRNFISPIGTDLTILHDPEMTIHDAFKVYTYPTTFLIDRKGVVKQYWIGVQQWDGHAIEEAIRQSLR